jgi:chromosome segregation ATPase
MLKHDNSPLVKTNAQIKENLRELSKAIHAYQQSLDNAVAEIEFLEKQIQQLLYQIEFAFTFPDGESLTLEQLADDYYRLRKQVGEW